MPDERRTFFDKDSGRYLGSYRGPEESNPFAGHPSVEGDLNGEWSLVNGEAVKTGLPAPEPSRLDVIEALLTDKGTVSRAEIEAKRGEMARAEK